MMYYGVKFSYRIKISGHRVDCFEVSFLLIHPEVFFLIKIQDA